MKTTFSAANLVKAPITTLTRAVGEDLAGNITKHTQLTGARIYLLWEWFTIFLDGVSIVHSFL
ncbi:MAG: hypothetical protein IPH20_25145 [Bacteroidales bacterium]|nr:hypothetical protein [Bacteroidales bacterium]